MPESEDEKKGEQKPARPMVRFEKRKDMERKAIELYFPNRESYPDIRAQLEPEDYAEYLRKLKELKKDL